MLAYRDGQAIVVCDGCYEPIGPATILDDPAHQGPSGQRRAHLVASGRAYAVLNGSADPLNATWCRPDGRAGDVHGPACGARLDAQPAVARAEQAEVAR